MSLQTALTLTHKWTQSFALLKTARFAASKTLSVSGKIKEKVLPSVVTSRVVSQGRWNVEISTTCLKMSKVNSSSATLKCLKSCCRGVIHHCSRIDPPFLKLARIPLAFSKAQTILPSRRPHCRRFRLVLAPQLSGRASVILRSTK